jgi:multiple sugar transport system permease protein
MKEKKIKTKAVNESVSTRLISDNDIKRPVYKIIYFFIVAFLVGMCMMTILPTLWIFASAFKSTKEFLAIPPTIIPRSFEPGKIIDVWKNVNFFRYLKNSGILILGDLVCTIVFNGMAGYVFSKLKPAGSNFVYRLVFLTMLLPTSMNMIPLYSEFVKFPILGINITGSFIPLWMMASFSAFNIMLFKNFFDSVPTSIVEAARIDGQTEIGIFTKIIIPLSKPIIMVVAIFTIVAAWGNFMWPYLVLKKETMQPVAVMLFNMQSQLSVDKYMVVMMLSIIPPLVVFFCFSKQIMGGMNLGGVKE